MSAYTEEPECDPGALIRAPHNPPSSGDPLRDDARRCRAELRAARERIAELERRSDNARAALAWLGSLGAGVLAALDGRTS